MALADEAGIEAVSMRNLAQALGVVPMALYNHVANKDQLLDGVVEVIVGEFDPPIDGVGWKDAIRQRVLSARQALLPHPPRDARARQQVFPTPTPPTDPDERAAMFAQVAARYPHIVEIATVGSHDDGRQVGRGCDDQFEFEFALDILLRPRTRCHTTGSAGRQPRLTPRRHS